MAFSRNKAIDVIHEAQPKKIVIQTGPTFGTTLGFILLGAAIGAAGAIALKNKASAPKSLEDSLLDDLDNSAPNSSAITERVNAVTARVKKLASRARDTIASASEAIGPAVQEAISEGKAVASQTERELQKELHEELDKS